MQRFCFTNALVFLVQNFLFYDSTPGILRGELLILVLNPVLKKFFQWGRLIKIDITF